MDNAPMESFWGTLKNELVHHRRYVTREQARQEIIEYIEIFYDRQRRQARLGTARWRRLHNSGIGSNRPRKAAM